MHKDDQHHGDWSEFFFQNSSRTAFLLVLLAGWLAGYDFQIMVPASYMKKFLNSSWDYFYHTRTKGSVRGSTKFRHAPLKANTTTDLDFVNRQQHFGYDIPPQLWQTRFPDIPDIA